MAGLTVALLVAGVAGVIFRPLRLPAWALPAAGVIVEVASGALSLTAAARALHPLVAPIAFLLAAVPLAVLLDRLGFFAAVARRIGGAGRRVGGLWILAALVTTVLNLDASVVLLTPLYVQIARKVGRDPLRLAVIPVLLACLASTALPVSNLTNLIAVSETGATTGGFLAHLALPSLVAVAVGWWRYRRVVLDAGGLARGPARPAGSAQPSHPAPADGAPGVDPADERQALLIGGVIVAVVLVGFTAGRSVGIAPWMVAGAADVVLLAVVRRVPWREVPVGTALVALTLGLLAAAAVRHLPIHQLLAGTSTAAMARTALLSGAAANLVNNLPAVLVALPALGRPPGPSLWAVMIGVDMGPLVLATGSLASLLWLDTLGRLDVAANARDFMRFGVRVGLPAAGCAFAVQLGLHATGLVR